MKSEAHQTETKVIRYIIGASILLLALILFSELSCSILGVCSSWLPFAHILGFWEIMGISTAILFTTLAIRSLQRNRLSKSGKEQKPEAPTLNTPSDTCTCSPSSLPQQRTQGWRMLFEQLSDEEKKDLKILMEERCFKTKDGNQCSQPQKEEGATI